MTRSFITIKPSLPLTKAEKCTGQSPKNTSPHTVTLKKRRICARLRLSAPMRAGETSFASLPEATAKSKTRCSPFQPMRAEPGQSPFLHRQPSTGNAIKPITPRTEDFSSRSARLKGAKRPRKIHPLRTARAG